MTDPRAGGWGHSDELYSALPPCPSESGEGGEKGADPLSDSEPPLILGSGIQKGYSLHVTGKGPGSEEPGDGGGSEASINALSVTKQRTKRKAFIVKEYIWWK